MNINWYPGHMKKTRQSIESNLPLVDIVFELIDARIPYSSRNPIIDSIIKNKARIIVLNKMDLASPKGNRAWEDYFAKKGIRTVLINSLNGVGIVQLINSARDLTKDKRQAYKEKGVINRPLRAMIIGIPNVGKSTLINALSGRKGARTGNVPGITKGNQWIKTKGNIELLDTPGILWPKFEDKEVGMNLAFIGSIKDQILDIESLSLYLLKKLLIIEPEKVEKRYNISAKNRESLQVLNDIAIKRGCLIRGGEIDYTKTANIILDEFRKGTIGQITLEFPDRGE